MPRLSWLVKLYKNLTYVRMRPAAIVLNYSIKDIRNDVRQNIFIYYYEKSQLNRLVWGSLMVAPIRIHVHYVYWIHKITKANSSMYPSYSLDFDLVCKAIGVHLE